MMRKPASFLTYDSIEAMYIASPLILMNTVSI